MVIAAADGDLQSDLRGAVAIGASAGGPEALSHLAAGLSPDVPFAYLMVLPV
ncbi:chemotaxis protein CheB, partial [Mycobacterium avium]|uniref:chemotaxis protein CheB n=1 Tax=Mycobacterium avium TaxID=1764 RepID=UPI002351B788